MALTAKQANELAQLIADYAEAKEEAAFAGSLSPDDAATVRGECEACRVKLNAFIQGTTENAK